MRIFNTVLNTTAIMMALMAIGYFLGRKKLVSDKAGRDLGVLEVRLFLPAYLFIMLAENVVPEKISINMQYLLYGTLFLGAMIVILFLLSRIYPGNRLAKLMIFYIMLYPNFGYFGYPVIDAAFGKEVLSQYIIFALPITFAVNTHGAYLMSTSRSRAEGDKSGFTLNNLKTIPFEVLIAVVLGTAFGLLGVKLPAVVTGFFSFTGACMSPVSMLLAGFVLSALPLKQLFRSLESYIINAIKLIVMPLIACVILYLLGVRGYLLAFMVIFNALPVGMNVVIFAKPEQPDYVSTGVTCFISYIIALITVPVTFGILSLLL